MSPESESVEICCISAILEFSDDGGGWDETLVAAFGTVIRLIARIRSLINSLIISLDC